VGFTSWDNETLNQYFHAHIPRAVSLFKEAFTALCFQQYYQQQWQQQQYPATSQPSADDLLDRSAGRLLMMCVVIAVLAVLQ
jgi:hypothetical protein